MSGTLVAPIHPGEKHLAAVLLVDTSMSMMEKPIEELNHGLEELPFKPAMEYQAPKLVAEGLTALNEAIDTALDVLEERKDLYKQNGINYYRPWLFVLTDGEATDEERESATKARLRGYIDRKKVVFMPMAIGESANKEKLREYYPEDAPSKVVLSADSKHFKEAFVWLSESLTVIAKSDPTVSEEVNLPPTPSIITVGINE